MGIDSELRRLWKAMYPSAWEVDDPTYSPAQRRAMQTGDPAAAAAAVGSRHPISLFDFINTIKIPPPKSAVTWFDYLKKCSLVHIHNAYTNGAKVVVITKERGAPSIKAIEWGKRYANTHPAPLSAVPPIMGYGRIPRHIAWKDLIANKRVVQELIHYITHSLLDRDPESPIVQSNNGYIFKPPLGCKLYLHGGRWDLPPRGSPVGRAPPHVYEVTHDLVTAASGAQEMHCTMQRCDPAMFPEQHVDQLLEGEMACLYYSTFFPDANCMITAPDGDLIPQLLLMARDRIDPATGAFRNVHTLRLVGVNGGGWHQPEYIDINKLYLSMLADPALQAAGVQDPVLAHCALCCLVKNDYIHKYGFGIGYYGSVKDGELRTPHVFRAFYRDPGRFAKLFTTVSNVPIGASPLSHWRQPLVDEKLFYELTQHMYVSMYEERAARSQKAELPPVIASRIPLIEAHLRERVKDPRKHIMSRATARVFARQLLWVLEYWINNPRASCAFESPTAQHGGISLYGWEMEAGICRQAERVSTERPSRKRSYEAMVGSAPGEAELPEVAAAAAPTSATRYLVPRSPLLVLPTPSPVRHPGEGERGGNGEGESVGGEPAMKRRRVDTAQQGEAQ